jgi:competence protein ComEA
MNFINLVRTMVLFVFIFLSASVFAATNLNTASQSELEALPGVGTKTAEQIISHRPFKSVDDLKSIKGIGDAKFDKLKGLVIVDTTATAPATTAPVTTNASKTATTTGRTGSTTQMAAGEKVSLNNASLEQLENLPGIGPKKAKAIIDARPFKSVEDVMKVKGIKAGTFNKIKDNLTL